MSDQTIRLTRRQFLGATAALAAGPSIPSQPEGEQPHRVRISYYRNGEIYVNMPGEPEGQPVTTGHWDFKPSWSKTGNMLVGFRRVKDDPVVTNWKTAIFIVNVDGTGFRFLSDGTHTDFNPTWTRDGSNTPVWNRKNEKTGGFYVVQSHVDAKPGQEKPITDPSFSTWVHSSLVDGRLLVAARHPTQGWGYFLLERKEGTSPEYQPIACELARKGLLDRISVSPNEKLVCFSFQPWTQRGSLIGRTLYIAEFDVDKRIIANPQPFANKEGKPFWFDYPRWVDGESAVVFHSTETGRGQLYLYRLADGSTRRISTNPKADYRYPHGEAAPC